jgi:hypothetical protein
MRTLLVATLAVATSSGAVLGQDRPDFSGKWVRVNPAGDATQLVTQDDATLTFYYESDGVGTAVSYKLDGTETTRSTLIHETNLTTLARAEWIGGTLKIAETITFPGAPKRQETQLWWLDAQGRLIVEFTNTTEGQGPTSGVRISRKAP